MRFYSLILRDKQQDPPAALCDRCQSELYAGDTLYLLGGLRLCGECVEDKFLALTTPQKAELLGAVPLPAAESRPRQTRESIHTGPEASVGGPGAPPRG